MMKKSNKILVGCLALLLVLSVGYAYFSDTITINGTATAKGDFDITTTCETGISSKLGTAETLGLDADGGYENDSCTITDDEVTIKVGFLYPGAKRYFTVKFTNNGTINAALDMADIEKTEQICVADNIEGENQECVSGNELNGYSANIYATIAGTGKGYAMEDSEGNLLTESEISEFYDATNGILTLKPGYSLYLLYNSYIGHTTSIELTTNEMFIEFTSTIKMPFNQTTN